MTAEQPDSRPFEPAAHRQLDLGRVLGVWSRVAHLFQNNEPSALEQIQTRLAAHQLARLIHGNVTAVFVPWEHIVPTDRHDLVIIGSRGSGKTALAIAWCQELQQKTELPFRALRFKPAVAEQIGAETTTSIPREPAIVLADESVLHARPGRKDRPLLETLALARHRGIYCVWTGQNLSTLSLDILRMEAILACKRIDPLASRFDRAEAVDVLASAMSLQSLDAGPDETVLHANGRWFKTLNPLPVGWDDDLSRLWA